MQMLTDSVPIYQHLRQSTNPEAFELGLHRVKLTFMFWNFFGAPSCCLLITPKSPSLSHWNQTLHVSFDGHDH